MPITRLAWRSSTQTAHASVQISRHAPTRLFMLHRPYSTAPKHSNLPRWLVYGAPVLVVGGVFYAFRSSSSPTLDVIIKSPACIPSKARQPTFPIPSPPDRSFLSKIADFLRRNIFSPIRTGIRFLRLVIIFSPVIFTVPMLFVGVPDGKFGEGWGAIWWYDTLTASMQRAGPTFIKVWSHDASSEMLMVLVGAMGGLSP